jgi:hypothetical protein
MGPRNRRFDSDDSIEWVCCRICSDYLRVISGRHLSKHDTDRDTYMKEYHLTPDELIAKAFRMIQSTRRGYYPHGKSDWIAAVNKVQNGTARFAGYLQDKYKHLYEQGIWIFGDWDKALLAAGFDPTKMRMRRLWDQEKTIHNRLQARSESTALSQLRD